MMTRKRLRTRYASAYIGLSASTLEKLRLYDVGAQGIKNVLYDTTDLFETPSTGEAC